MKKCCGHGGAKSFLVQADILNYQTQDFDYHLIFTSPQASFEIHPCRSTETNQCACNYICEWLSVWVSLSWRSKNFQIHRVWQCLCVLWPCEFPVIILTDSSLCVRPSLTISRITNESLMTTPSYISACSCALDFLINLNVSTRTDHDPISWSLVVWPLSRVMGCYNRRCARLCAAPYQWSSIILTGLSN